MSDQNTVDEFGSEPISSIEVKEQGTTEQVETGDSTQEKASTPESIPYDRFSQVNKEKNEIKAKYDELQANVNEYLSNSNRQSAQDQETANSVANLPNIDTVEDLLSHLDQRVEAQVQERLKPIEEKTRQDAYVSNVESFFNSTGATQEERSEMDSYFDSLPDYRKKSVVDAVSLGDTTVLNEIKSFVTSQKAQNLQGLTNQAVSDDANRVSQPASTKVVRAGNPSFSDKMDAARKTGDFTSVFESLIT
jgi:hypothetical protein